MNIVIARPPNYDQIAAVFPIERFPGAFFCYGDTIYNPSGSVIPPALLAHESVHSQRQTSLRIAGNPERWWEFYLADPAFRLAEELPAHRAEWQHFCGQGYGRGERRRYLSQIAQRLSSPLYGSLVTKDKARSLIGA